MDAQKKANEVSFISPECILILFLSDSYSLELAEKIS